MEENDLEARLEETLWQRVVATRPEVPGERGMMMIHPFSMDVGMTVRFIRCVITQ